MFTMFMPLIQKRRSIRRFLDKPLEKEKIDLLVEAALRSPSSRGINPWEFIVVTDRDELEKLAGAKEHGSAFLKHAPLGIVVCANPAKSDVWIEDASIASIVIHLAAASMDLGSCWIQIRERMCNESQTAQVYIAERLNIPPDLQVESIIAIGYPSEEKKGHSQDELQYEKVHSGSFGNAYSRS
jgi:nitroreductase